MPLWVVLDIMEILGGVPSNYIYSGSILPVALIYLLSCWSQHWYQLRFAFSQNVALTKVVYVMTRWAYHLYTRFRYPLISPMI